MTTMTKEEYFKTVHLAVKLVKEHSNGKFKYFSMFSDKRKVGYRTKLWGAIIDKKSLQSLQIALYGIAIVTEDKNTRKPSWMRDNVLIRTIIDIQK